MPVLDSGERREFKTGAVRDISKGKGRCDLLPLDIVADFIDSNFDLNLSFPKGEVVRKIEDFKVSGDDTKHLITAFRIFCQEEGIDPYTAILEASIQFEEGAEKYGENNWQKGMNVSVYIDSGTRHYLKHSRGDVDEPHNRAFIWNVLTACWTVKHKPELNNYSQDYSNE